MNINEKMKEEMDIFFKEIGRAADSKYGILISHLYVESLLERYIQAKLPKKEFLAGKNGLGFNDKLNLVCAFGEIDPQLSDSLRKLTSIRNNCAHVFAHEIADDEVEAYGRTLGKDYKRLLNDYPSAEKGGIAPISYFVCGQVLAQILAAEGYQ